MNITASGCHGHLLWSELCLAQIKIALVQMRVTKTKSENLTRAREAIRNAASNGASLCVLPEMFNCPYGNDSFPVYAEARVRWTNNKDKMYTVYPVSLTLLSRSLV